MNFKSNIFELLEGNRQVVLLNKQENLVFTWDGYFLIQVWVPERDGSFIEKCFHSVPWNWNGVPFKLDDAIAFANKLLKDYKIVEDAIALDE